MKGRWRLVVSEQFCAAHALRNYHGKCENLHGHNFDAEIVVEGTELDAKTEILLDFGELKAALREIIQKLDHRDLNKLEPFRSANPSSENLARYIGIKISEFLRTSPDPQAGRVRLISAGISEKPGQSAIWLPDQD